MTNLKVLWVDDKPLPEMERRCKKYGITLIRVGDSTEGKKLLTEKIHEWDFVLLDGRGTKKGEVETTRGAIDMLSELKKQELVRKIPCCIFSAYADKTDLECLKDYSEDIRIFSKIETDDLTKPYKSLFNYIRKSSSLLPERQVKDLYSNVFDAAEAIGMPEEHINTLTDILKSLTFKKFRRTCRSGNDLRKIIEFICKKYYEVGLIPNECMKKDKNGNLRDINLTDAVNYLCGAKTATVFGQRTNFGVFDAGGPVLCEFLGELISQNLNFTQMDSHDNSLINTPNVSDINHKITEFRKALPNTMYIYSATLNVCDLIKYSAEYISQNTDKGVNSARCVSIEAQFQSIDTNGARLGIIEVDSNGKPHIGDFIEVAQRIDKGTRKSLLKAGTIIAVNNVSPNREQSGFKFYVSDFKIIK